jgi:hypothetical protein
MNVKNKRKRQATTLDKKAHRRVKMMAAKFDKRIEDLIDEAVFAYLKNPDPVLHSQFEE